VRTCVFRVECMFVFMSVCIMFRKKKCLNNDTNACWVALVVPFPIKLVLCRSEFSISRYCNFKFASALKRKENEAGGIGDAPPNAEPLHSRGRRTTPTPVPMPVVPGHLCRWYRATLLVLSGHATTS
jgi:hypothetical protein